jgi:hypothetical protein
MPIVSGSPCFTRGIAKRTVTTTHYIDDLDGSKAEGTVTFAHESVTYEIDLSKANKKALTAAIMPYVAAARTVKPGRALRPAEQPSRI